MVPDYSRYLAGERQTLLARYLCVERDLATLRLEYVQVLCDEKRTKAAAWERAVGTGMSASAADKSADHSSVHAVAESILLRGQVDVLEREAAMILVLFRET